MNNLSYIDFLAEFSIHSAHPGGKTITQSIFQTENLDQKASILDVGCGTGETASFLANTFQCNVSAIEPHPVMLKKARERFIEESPSIKLVEGSIEQLPFEDESFDYLLIESVLTFVNVKKSLHECRRVLKKGGILLLNEMTLLEPLDEKDLVTLKSFYKFSECNEEHEWRTHLIQTGFKQIKKLIHSNEELSEINELELRPDMDPQLFDILDEHERLLEKYKGRMGNCVFRCIK